MAWDDVKVLQHSVSFVKLFKHYCSVLTADKYEFTVEDDADKNKRFHNRDKKHGCFFFLAWSVCLRHSSKCLRLFVKEFLLIIGTYNVPDIIKNLKRALELQKWQLQTGTGFTILISRRWLDTWLFKTVAKIWLLITSGSHSYKRCYFFKLTYSFSFPRVDMLELVCELCGIY